MLHIDKNSIDVKNALKIHCESLKCYLLNRIKGKYDESTNPEGYKCGIDKCVICKNKLKKINTLSCIFDVLSIEENIDKILNSEPEDLLKLNESFIKQFETKGCNKEIIKSELSKIFIKGYEDWFVSKAKRYCAYHLVLNLKIHTCLYCNRNYVITIVNKVNDKIARAELDHWFPKTDFPLIALSFYNLIPSCHTCNSSIKGTGSEIKKKDIPKVSINWDEYANPYNVEVKDSNFKYSFQFKDIANFKLKIKNDTNPKINKTLNLFKIKEIYNAHSDKELKDLIDLRYKYSDNYIDILINKTFKGLMSKEEIYRMIFGIEIEEDNYHKRPFSKFKHDIIEELKNFKE